MATKKQEIEKSVLKKAGSNGNAQLGAALEVQA